MDNVQEIITEKNTDFKLKEAYKILCTIYRESEVSGSVGALIKLIEGANDVLLTELKSKAIILAEEFNKKHMKSNFKDYDY